MRLLDALWHYDSLVARVPLSQWRDEDSDECADCACEYVQLEQAEREARAKGREVRPARRATIKPCSHREKGQVGEGVPFRKPFHNPKASDPMAVVALKADIDRQIDQLPGLARDLFDLLYRTRLLVDPDTGKTRRRTLVEVRVLLRRPWSDVTRCHDFHLGRMERALADWFPAAERDKKPAA